jgi:hypothetical protein
MARSSVTLKMEEARSYETSVRQSVQHHVGFAKADWIGMTDSGFCIIDTVVKRLISYPRRESNLLFFGCPTRNIVTNDFLCTSICVRFRARTLRKKDEINITSTKLKFLCAVKEWAKEDKEVCEIKKLDKNYSFILILFLN